MAKYTGLSHLADVARETYGPGFYPVKKRGKKRRLNPNWDAIRWLETESREYCEIEYAESDARNTELVYTYAYGRRVKSNSRPMFQVIREDGFPGMLRTPCQACDRFEISWACAEHTEIPWDAKTRQWVRPCTGSRASCNCTPCRESRVAVYSDDLLVDQGRVYGMGAPLHLYEQFIETFGGPLSGRSQLTLNGYFTDGGLRVEAEAQHDDTT